MAKVNKLVCSECGGTNIQVLAWVDANTNEYKGEYSDGDISYNWCEDCQSEVKFEVKEFEEELTS
jgi:hypothetical protein